jgi:hypothetical protein
MRDDDDNAAPRSHAHNGLRQGLVALGPCACRPSNPYSRTSPHASREKAHNDTASVCSPARAVFAISSAQLPE